MLKIMLHIVGTQENNNNNNCQKANNKLKKKKRRLHTEEESMTKIGPKDTQRIQTTGTNYSTPSSPTPFTPQQQPPRIPTPSTDTSNTSPLKTAKKKLDNDATHPRTCLVLPWNRGTVT